MSKVIVVELANPEFLRNLRQPEAPRRIVVQVPGLATLLTVHISALQGSLLAFFQGSDYHESLPHYFHLALNDEALPPDCMTEQHCFTGLLPSLAMERSEFLEALVAMEQQDWVHVYALSRRVQ